MLVRLFDSDAERCYGQVELPSDDLPDIIVITPNPVCPTMYFKHMGLDQYYEITSTVKNLANTPILKDVKHGTGQTA